MVVWKVFSGMYVEYNPNPLYKRVEDCAVRAVSKALNVDWDTAFDLLTEVAKKIADLQNSNLTIDILLRSNGFKREILPNECPFCYTAEDFAKEHDYGIYVLGFGDHVATIIDGDIYDSWDSSSMTPLYFYRKES